MRLRTKLLIINTAVFALSIALFLYSIRDTLRKGYAENVEEMMVDISQLMASTIEQNSLRSDEPLSTVDFARSFATFRNKSYSSQIFDLLKDKPALDTYVTDAKGIVLYSSSELFRTGSDLSAMNDVSRTLKGLYGARSSRTDQNDPWSSVFFVNAPIRDRVGKIVGTVSVIKQRQDAYHVVRLSILKIGEFALLIGVVMSIFGVFLFMWLTRPLQELRAYALAVSTGDKVFLPKLSGSEILDLGRAFEEMRIALEGKKSIESFTQSLTHELKSPLSAIQGAAELLRDSPINPEQKKSLLGNIIEQSNRAHIVLEHLLQIASLEAKNDLDQKEAVNLTTVARSVMASLLSLQGLREVRVSLQNMGESAVVMGDAFLIEQAVRNLVQNAIDFSGSGDEVTIRFAETPNEIQLGVEDLGTGIPEFARSKIFEKFFSLERPSTGKKSSGLGLSFVREVMHLHRGRVWAESPIFQGRGTRAWLSFPRI